MLERINLHKVPNESAPSTITDTRDHFEDIFQRNNLAYRASREIQDLHSSRGSLALNDDYINNSPMVRRFQKPAKIPTAIRTQPTSVNVSMAPSKFEEVKFPDVRKKHI